MRHRIEPVTRWMIQYVENGYRPLFRQPLFRQPLFRQSQSRPRVRFVANLSPEGENKS